MEKYIIKKTKVYAGIFSIPESRSGTHARANSKLKNNLKKKIHLYSLMQSRLTTSPKQEPTAEDLSSRDTPY